MSTLTTAEAAAKLDLSERQLQHLAKLGRIPGAEKRSAVWQFPGKPIILPPPRMPRRLISPVRVELPPGFVDQFWAQVAKSAECWIWQGAITNKGYGYASMHGRVTTVHRMAWEMTRDPIPDGIYVLHDCPGGDNRLCVNPDHLFLGTSKDNTRDAMRKGRRKSKHPLN